jgi:hypothetical protein
MEMEKFMKSNSNKCKCGKEATRRFSVESDQGFFYCCQSKKCKDQIESDLFDTNYRNQYFQGKSLRNYKYSSEVLFLSIATLTALVLCSFIWNIVNNFLK